MHIGCGRDRTIKITNNDRNKKQVSEGNRRAADQCRRRTKRRDTQPKDIEKLHLIKKKVAMGVKFNRDHDRSFAVTESVIFFWHLTMPKAYSLYIATTLTIPLCYPDNPYARQIVGIYPRARHLRFQDIFGIECRCQVWSPHLLQDSLSCVRIISKGPCSSPVAFKFVINVACWKVTLPSFQVTAKWNEGDPRRAKWNLQHRTTSVTVLIPDHYEQYQESDSPFSPGRRTYGVLLLLYSVWSLSAMHFLEEYPNLGCMFS